MFIIGFFITITQSNSSDLLQTDLVPPSNNISCATVVNQQLQQSPRSETDLGFDLLPDESVCTFKLSSSHAYILHHQMHINHFSYI